MGNRNQNGPQEQPLAETEAIDILETDFCSEADSESGHPISIQDFRVDQFKTHFTSSEKLRPYWTWDPEQGRLKCHVHKTSALVDQREQVELHDFSVRLKDVASIVWNLRARQVYLEMCDRAADIMVTFKRPNTMQRFIIFCQWEQIHLIEKSRWVFLSVVIFSYCSRLLLTIYSQTMERLCAAMSSNTTDGRKQDGLHEKQRALPASVERSGVYTKACDNDKGIVSLSSFDVTIEGVTFSHDGTVYTHPECVKGVPLEKIAPGHSYWDPRWHDLRALIEPTLRSWEAKLPKATNHQRNHCVRQVNRGNTILKFLENGEISPYQLLSKPFLQMGNGTITSYNTLYRLCETLDALAEYKMDVKPVDWLRKRLYELSSEQGAMFSLSKTICDFYHDTKLVELRRNAGKTTIGRRPHQS